MCLVHHLDEGPAVQVGPDPYPVPSLLLLSVLFLPRDNQIAHPGALLLLQWALYHPCL